MPVLQGRWLYSSFQPVIIQVDENAVLMLLESMPVVKTKLSFTGPIILPGIILCTQKMEEARLNTYAFKRYFVTVANTNSLGRFQLILPKQ